MNGILVFYEWNFSKKEWVVCLYLRIGDFLFYLLWFMIVVSRNWLKIDKKKKCDILKLCCFVYGILKLLKYLL